MPQKYGKHMKPLPGYTANDDRLREIRKVIDDRREKQHGKDIARKFRAEPEELAVLDQLALMPPHLRAPAAESLIIARHFQKSGAKKAIKR